MILAITGFTFLVIHSCSIGGLPRSSCLQSREEMYQTKRGKQIRTAHSRSMNLNLWRLSVSSTTLKNYFLKRTDGSNHPCRPQSRPRRRVYVLWPLQRQGEARGDHYRASTGRYSIAQPACHQR